MLNAIFEKADIFVFVMCRMTGFVVFNPVFGRRNIPATTKAALAFVLAVFALFQMDSNTAVDTSNIVMTALLLLKEFAFGFLIGTVVNMFFSVVSVSGEMLDIQMGLGMSKMYDPASNIQMPLTGNFYNIVLMLMFFLTNSHITLIKILMLSFQISPINSLYFNSDIGMYLVQLFGNILVLSLKLAFPVLAAELISETGVGIIMRAVPQINVFVVGVQLKIIVGIVVMLISAPISVWFFDGMLSKMNDSVYEAMTLLVR